MAFVKPYPDGWENGEVGNTPITAEILNNNYDAFLVEVSEDIGKFDFETTPTAGYALIWDATTSTYKPTAIPASVHELNDLSDVSASSPSVGQVLRRGEALGTAVWTNSWLYVNDIKDIILSNPATGDILVCEMTPDPILEVPKWKNKPFPVSANPSDTATATLTKIKINDVIYGISGGGGGGSTVSYTAVVQSGTKLGTITIDGVGYDVYAPTVNVPTKTSDLTNDSNFVADASYVHTDNNYSTTDKNKVADLVQVVANPSSGTSAGNLTSISVGGTKYDIPSGGGGGTTVVANPSGTATEELEKLQVGSTIYSIPEGGESGSSGFDDIQGTLTAGSTSITISSPKIKSNSIIDVYTDGGIDYNNLTTSVGSVTITYDAQQTDLGVLVSVRKPNIPRTFDISLADFVENKIWGYYDAAYTTVSDTDDGIRVRGGETAGNWTTSGAVGIDLNEFTVPSGLSAIKFHFTELILADYAAVRIINSDTLYSGASGGSDAMLQANGIYQLEDISGIYETDYDLTVPCNSLTGRYLYIMLMDGAIPNTTSGYSNAYNGSFDGTVDGIDFVTGGNS